MVTLVMGDFQLETRSRPFGLDVYLVVHAYSAEYGPVSPAVQLEAEVMPAFRTLT